MPSTGRRLRAMQAWHRHQNFLLMIAYLQEHPCLDCGESDPVVLDFDHLPGVEKRFEIARAVNASTRAWPTILKEIAKCEVVCANCHRRRTALRLSSRKHLVSQGEVPPAPLRLPRRRAEVPHGGGAKGRRGCPCEPCRSRRNAYARERRAAAAAAAERPQVDEDSPNDIEGCGSFGSLKSYPQ